MLSVATILLASVGIFCAQTRRIQASHGDIALANIEALMDTSSDDEKNEPEKCTRWTATANCFHNVKGTWCNMRITAIESYTKTSDVVICSHDEITQCLPLCSEKKI